MKSDVALFLFLAVFCLGSCDNHYHHPIGKVDTDKVLSKKPIDSSLYKQPEGDLSIGSSPIQSPQPTWIYTDQKDPSTSKIINSATLKATTVLQFKPTYS